MHFVDTCIKMYYDQNVIYLFVRIQLSVLDQAMVHHLNGDEPLRETIMT